MDAISPKCGHSPWQTPAGAVVTKNATNTAGSAQATSSMQLKVKCCFCNCLQIQKYNLESDSTIKVSSNLLMCLSMFELNFSQFSYGVNSTTRSRLNTCSTYMQRRQQQCNIYIYQQVCLQYLQMVSHFSKLYVKL